jgi:monofunctional biosynthetic peptidoglycan transglycosylase
MVPEIGLLAAVLCSTSSAREGERPGSLFHRVLVIIGRSVLVALMVSVLLVLCLRWIPPPTSAFMIERYFESFFTGMPKTGIRYRWVNWESISPEMPLAVVAAEDQMFPHHWGFDFEAISDAMEENRRGRRLRGASTITQQVAKNLFLWPGRSYVRKGLEAYFAILLELLWSKQRILEVYVNIAEFADGTYGVYAAADTLLGKSPAKLTRRDAARLAAVLPNPIRFRVKHPSRYVIRRQHWIEQQMQQLGGVSYLKGSN